MTDRVPISDDAQDFVLYRYMRSLASLTFPVRVAPSHWHTPSVCPPFPAAAAAGPSGRLRVAEAAATTAALRRRRIVSWVQYAECGNRGFACGRHPCGKFTLVATLVAYERARYESSVHSTLIHSRSVHATPALRSVDTNAPHPAPPLPTALPERVPGRVPWSRARPLTDTCLVGADTRLEGADEQSCHETGARGKGGGGPTRPAGACQACVRTLLTSCQAPCLQLEQHPACRHP